MELNTLYGMIEKEVSSLSFSKRTTYHLSSSERAVIKRGLTGPMEILNVGDYLRLDVFLNTKSGNGEIILHYFDHATHLKRWKVKAKHIEQIKMQMALEDDGKPPF